MAECSTPVAFRAAYAEAFARYLAVGDESSLHAAYELGREALAQELSILELALVQHDVLADALTDGAADDVGPTTTTAGAFFAEALSAFEMVRRGFRDARDAAQAERRQTALFRRLSSFLADASLAAGGSESYQELLQLVAEQALELTPAEYCVATATVGDNGPRIAFAATHGRPEAVPSWVGSTAAGRPPPGNPRRAADAGSPNGAVEDERPRTVLTVALRCLDGGELGAVEVFNRREGAFTDADEALLVHLAELTAGALERTRLYAEAAAPDRRLL